MDAFEQIISEILWMEGFWVRTSVKVHLTKEEKVKIGRKSSPRWELDVVAYSAKTNTLHIIECKSYLDSRGVTLQAFDGRNTKQASRYKLFNDANLRKVVFNRLRLQLIESGACSKGVKMNLCLACGKIASDKNREGLKKLFKKQGWELWDEKWLKEKLGHMAAQGYENQVSSVVAKLLLR